MFLLFCIIFFGSIYVFYVFLLFLRINNKKECLKKIKQLCPENEFFLKKIKKYYTTGLFDKDHLILNNSHFFGNVNFPERYDIYLDPLMQLIPPYFKNKKMFLKQTNLLDKNKKLFSLNISTNLCFVFWTVLFILIEYYFSKSYIIDYQSFKSFAYQFYFNMLICLVIIGVFYFLLDMIFLRLSFLNNEKEIDYVYFIKNKESKYLLECHLKLVKKDFIKGYAFSKVIYYLKNTQKETNNIIKLNKENLENFVKENQISLFNLSKEELDFLVINLV